MANFPKPYSHYDGYYNQPSWKDVRKAVLERDNYTCCQCGYVGQENISYKTKPKMRAMVVHHIIDRKHGGQDTADNLETLCMPCHNKIPGWHS